MPLDILCLTIFLLLILCRLALLHNITLPQRHKPNRFVQDLHISGMIRDACFESGYKRRNREDRAEAYLRRIISLTSATRVDNYCVFEIGRTTFHVHDKYVGRLQDATDPMCFQEWTCFYLANQHMPAAVRIATALLQLKNNPGLFDEWLTRKAAFRANGEVFRLIPEPPFGY